MGSYMPRSFEQYIVSHLKQRARAVYMLSRCFHGDNISFATCMDVSTTYDTLNAKEAYLFALSKIDLQIYYRKNETIITQSKNVF